MTVIFEICESRKGQYKVVFACDFCGKHTHGRKSHFDRKQRHYCSLECYSGARKTLWKKEEQQRYGTGFSEEERQRRLKARTTLNHAIRDGKVSRQQCCICGKKAEAHHDDYSEPLNVRWLCLKHHRECHKNPELMDGAK